MDPFLNPVALWADLVDALGITEEPGWTGAFTRRQAKGAMANGSRVCKAREDPDGDVTPLGTVGTVLGSISSPKLGAGYFVEWDNRPRHAMFVVGWKLRQRD